MSWKIKIKNETYLFGGIAKAADDALKQQRLSKKRLRVRGRQRQQRLTESADGGCGQRLPTTTRMVAVLWIMAAAAEAARRMQRRRRTQWQRRRRRRRQAEETATALWIMARGGGCSGGSGRSGDGGGGQRRQLCGLQAENQNCVLRQS
jgi:uncharacterized membrane protein YgcG